MNGRALLSLACALLVATAPIACGGDDDQGGEPSRGGYAGALSEQTDRVLAVREKLPEPGEAGNPNLVAELEPMAKEVSAAEAEIRKLQPPQRVLENHQFLLDAVAFVELDLRDLQIATDPGSATSALDEVKRHLDQVDAYTSQIVEKAGS